ncbi:7TM diverse intracellular signaling domain-containing protein [Oligoflexus tunisiensis]|uniref:7TM diverse intracellular signaling domain-containing protein n=1 Tax=Oligoflexus tunisiensis TaxID=708132 RepID=UPI00114CB1BF|nr:7TM diverse intracellular signaling domain-containing protein [Oligoflexus tunisiensis]
MRALGLILAFMLGLATEARAERVLSISEGFREQSLGSYLDVFEDPDGSLEIHDVAKQPMSFQPLPGAIPVYSFTDSAYWFRLVLHNPDAQDKKLFLQSGCSWLDSVTLYRPDGGSWSREEVGDLLPHNERQIRSILPTFQINLPAHEQAVYYLRVQTTDAFIMPVFLRAEEAHYEHERHKEYMSGVLFGLIGVMFIFNLIVYIFSRDLAYLIYSINLLAWFSLFFTLDGYAFAWLWPQSDWWTNRVYVLSIIMSTVWGTLFAKEFLRTYEIVPRVDRLINLWLASQIMLTLGTFIFAYTWVLLLACLSALFFCLMIPPVAFMVLRRGFRPARYYLCSWIFPAYTACHYLLIIFGVIPANGTNIYILHAGIALEVIMLSVALGDRMRQLTQERKDLQHGLEVARVVQESFLLKDIRTSTMEMDFIYRPSDALGGDWFACMEREDQQRLYVCLGDVTGHGIATSLITGSAAGSFQTAVLSLPSQQTLEKAAETLATQLNETILRVGTKQNAMMTCTLLVIDLVTLDCLYLNAGHVNVFVKSADVVHVYLRRGSILGFNRMPIFQPIHVPLSPGDIIILYSDGLVENQSEKAQALTPRTLTHLIRKSANIEDLKTDLARYMDQSGSQGQPHDDATVLMLRILSRQEPRTHPSTEVVTISPGPITSSVG